MNRDSLADTECLTIQEAIQVTGLTETTIRGWIRLGHLPATKRNGCWLIDPDDLEATQDVRHAGDALPRWRKDPARAGRRLRQLRERAHLSQLQLARATGLSHEVISRLELGRKPPAVTTLRRLAEALRISTNGLVSTDPIGGLSVLSTSEAAGYLEVPVSRIQKWLKAEALPGHKVSGQWRVPTIAVIELERGDRLRGKSRRLAPHGRRQDDLR